MKIVPNILKSEKVVLIWSCILLISICFLSCNKAEEIPAKTRHGANVFAYEIAGRFVGGNFNSAGNSIDFLDTTISIKHHTKYNKLNSTIERTLVLMLNDVDGFEKYQLNNAILYLSEFQLDTLYLYKSNFLDITYFNPNSKIISGEFDLNFAKYDSVFVTDTVWGDWEVTVSDSIQLKKGRFDIRYD